MLVALFQAIKMKVKQIFLFTQILEWDSLNVEC